MSWIDINSITSTEVVKKEPEEFHLSSKLEYFQLIYLMITTVLMIRNIRLTVQKIFMIRLSWGQDDMIITVSQLLPNPRTFWAVLKPTDTMVCETFLLLCYQLCLPVKVSFHGSVSQLFLVNSWLNLWTNWHVFGNPDFLHECLYLSLWGWFYSFGLVVTFGLI